MVARSVQVIEINDQIRMLEARFQAQRKAYDAHPMPSARERREHLKRLEKALLAHTDDLIHSINADFGHRSSAETLVGEMLVSVEAARYARKRVRRWMRPSRRHVGRMMLSTSARVVYQPLGVVGIIAPWNYPVQLSLVPLVYALAAGNRAMIKPSEATPRTAAALRTLLAECFDEDQVAVVEGEVEVGIAFSKQPFDHLLFTGSTGVGRHVMMAAAENLTPVTLELGGKSPTIIAHDAPMALAAERICFGKTINSGQSCVAPDYVLCPHDAREAFVEAMRQAFATMFPTVADNPDYTCVVNDRHYERLQDYLHDARTKGAHIVELNPAGDSFEPHARRMPLHLVLDATDDMTLMHEEIFGPLLPVILYDHLDEAIAYVKARPRPLALNYFDFDKANQRRIIEETHAGAVCVNDTLFHVAIDDLPFGGVGPSGMGHYHGREGFLTFSHGKGVYSRPRLNTAKLFYPPYGGRLQHALIKFFLHS